MEIFLYESSEVYRSRPDVLGRLPTVLREHFQTLRPAKG